MWLKGWHPEIRDSQRAAAAAVKQSEWWSGGTAPLLDLQAANDPFKPESKRNEMKDEFGSRVTVMVIPNASHALIPEQPKAVSRRSGNGSGACPEILKFRRTAAEETCKGRRPETRPWPEPREDVQMSLLVRVLCLIGLAVWPGVLAAQEFPNRPIKFIVPFPAGGPADTISRIVTEKMSSILGQPIVVETRAGAGGMIGINSVAKSAPDGYTIAIAPSSQLAMNVNLRDDMPFHPLKDLALITQIVSVPEILVVNEKVPAKTLAELVALAKAEPGKLVYASTGHGGMPHMATELFRLTAGIQLVHTPYTGAAPAVNDLLGGHVQMMFADVPVLLGNIQAGKLRALGIGSRTRIANLPAWRRWPNSACRRSRPTTGTGWSRRPRRRSRCWRSCSRRQPRRCVPPR